jgi:hypothetical protein
MTSSSCWRLTTRPLLRRSASRSEYSFSVSGIRLPSFDTVRLCVASRKSPCRSSAYRVNKFLHTLVDPRAREAFRADEAVAMRAAGLTDVERGLLLRRDWRALMHYGVIFFLLEKLAAVSGLSNLHVYAAMKGQTPSDFQKTRNAPGAVYSVSGRDGSDGRPRRS